MFHLGFMCGRPYALTPSLAYALTPSSAYAALFWHRQVPWQVGGKSGTLVVCSTGDSNVCSQEAWSKGLMSITADDHEWLY